MSTQQWLVSIEWWSPQYNGVSTELWCLESSDVSTE